MGSRALVEVALQAVKKRFVGVVSSRLPPDGPEYDLVFYKTKKLFESTVMGGKYGRATFCLDACRALQPHIDVDSPEMSAFAAASATLEMIQSFYLIADDIMDGSETRRGRPCWYRQPGVGMSAINDAFLMDSVVEDVLRHALPGHVNIERLCEAYRRSKQKTLIGQMLDTSSCHQVGSFTWERYELLVENKTSHYTVFHPLEQALIIADSLGFHGDVKHVAYQIGFLFQAQDDVLDVFGDAAETGKLGTDVQDGKCTWLAVRALQKIQNRQDRRAFDEFKANFGKDDVQKVNGVKNLYDDLGLQDEFRKFEAHFAGQIARKIHDLPDELDALRPVLENFMANLVARKK